MHKRNDTQTAFAKYRRDLEQCLPLGDREERRLIRAYVAGNFAAGERVVLSHLRYVVDAARHFVGRGVSLEDLIQEGNLGLLRALEKFDASRMSGRDGKHVRFLAYASHWVKALMSLAILEKGKIIKVNRNVQNKIGKMRKMDRQIETDLGRPATLAEVAVRLGIKVEEAEKLRRLQAFRFSSFDQPLRRLEDEHGDGEVTLYGLVAAEQPSAEHACSERMLAEVRHEALSKATAMLDPREQKILRERLLCDPVERKSQARLADEIGVSRGRIQQLEVRTKGKLRRLMRDDWDRAEGMGQS